MEEGRVAAIVQKRIRLNNGELLKEMESLIKKSAVELLKHRQKLIQLANTSELRWKFVSEYEQNPIADESDDEKRIYKAETRLPG